MKNQSVAVQSLIEMRSQPGVRIQTYKSLLSSVGGLCPADDINHLPSAILNTTVSYLRPRQHNQHRQPCTSAPREHSDIAHRNLIQHPISEW